MKKIGMIGGLSWESTIEYYRLMNRLAKDQKGRYAQVELILYSVNREEILTYKEKEEWDKIGAILSEKAQLLEKSGCDFIMLCSNTMHKVADHIIDAVNVPFLHILDETAKQIVATGIKKVGFLGTSVTMTNDFYLGRLRDYYGLDILVPEKEDQMLINEIIYNELCIGQIHGTSRDKYKEVIRKLNNQGAEGIILGCTEITLLIKDEDVPGVPLFDTTYIHAYAAVQKSLNEC